MQSEPRIKQIYRTLLSMYGRQGWWPLLDCDGTNPTKTGSIRGYHPADYSYPKTDSQRFEVCVGALLVQATSWIQVERVLRDLKALGALNPVAMQKINVRTLQKVLKPVGYFRQKSTKLKAFTQFYLSLNGQTPMREQLLNLWGVGPETADSILLYAYGQPHFVVDSYTRRILLNLGLINEKTTYDEVRALFENGLQPPNTEIYGEYHALIVEHAKRFYGRGMKRSLCPIYLRYKVTN